MKKTTTVLSVISIVFAALAILLAISLSTFLWEPCAAMLFAYPEDVIEIGPVIPIGSVVSLLGCLAFSIILLATSKSKRHIALEIVLVVIWSIVFPLLTYSIARVQVTLIHNIFGIVTATSYSYTSTMLDFPIRLSGLSSTISLLLCGMRIADKINYKKHMN